MTTWGSNLRADSLSNIPLNSRGSSVAFTFVAARNEPIVAIRLTSPIRTGYTAGTGGDIQAMLYDVANATSFHETFLVQNNSDPYAPLSFAQLTPALVAGDTYNLILQNVADDPVNNWRSVDGLVVNAVDALDPANSTQLNGVPHPTNQPMWELIYASSTQALPMTQGVGYVDVPNGAAVPLSTGVRQVLQPTASRTITGGMLSLRGLTSPGMITFFNGSAFVVQATLYVPAIPNGWSLFEFQSPITLGAGQTYYMVPTGTTGSAVPLQKGWSRASDGVTKLYTFGPQTFFNEGNAQQIVNGAYSDWISEQGAADPRMDLMFSLFLG